MYSDLIQELKRYGLSNGSALGRHMGIMDEAADAIERLISDLEEANKRAKTAEAERDAAVEVIEKIEQLQGRYYAFVGETDYNNGYNHAIKDVKSEIITWRGPKDREDGEEG